MLKYDESEAIETTYPATGSDAKVGLTINIPDGTSAIMLKTSEGKEVVLRCLPYKKDGPPQCIDVMAEDPSMRRHDNGTPGGLAQFRLMSFEGGSGGDVQTSTTAAILLDWEIKE